MGSPSGESRIHVRGTPIEPESHDGAERRQQQHRRALDRIPLGTKNHVIAAIGEFVGTFMFLLFAFGGANVVNTAPDQGQPADLSANPARLLSISLCFGISLAVNAWVFYRISGGLFNPAVTIGLAAVGAVPPARAAVVIVSQLAGGIAAAGLVAGLLPNGLYIATVLSNDTSVAQGLFIEVFLTAQLVFTILMLAVEKHRATPMAPVGIGLSLFITQMMGIYYTGGSVNPARSFGPAVVTGSFPGYHWIYFVGPILGALLAAGFYKLLKALEYETVNPGQDYDGFADAFRTLLLEGGDRGSGGGAFSKGPGAPHYHHHHHRGGPAAPGAASGAPLSRDGTTVGSYGEGPQLEAGRHD
ncbi:putative aquaporin rerated other eukaryote [Rosellinia necatrix]|uniref:Putative aquaporin rerated other eukaryote n=1 Tax=Rosellinia necatrix TaxID=77044 RepID=A0A1W2TXM5_ROSNE|nr:putative aquaporin rerated other eukaryote [Rosellinia necatrix]